MQQTGPRGRFMLYGHLINEGLEMNDWKPKPGDTVMVVNPNGYGIEYGEQVIGQNVEFKTQVMSGRVPVAVVEWDGGCYCFRMDMLAQPVDPRRAVLDEPYTSANGFIHKNAQVQREEAIIRALRKLDNLPPF